MATRTNIHCTETTNEYSNGEIVKTTTRSWEEPDEYGDEPAIELVSPAGLSPEPVAHGLTRVN